MYKSVQKDEKKVFFTIFGLIELPMSSRPTYQQCAMLKSKPSSSAKKDQNYVLVDFKKMLVRKATNGSKSLNEVMCFLVF